MKYLLLTILVLILFSTRYVQAQGNAFVNEGQIVFERRVNVYPVLAYLLAHTKNVPADEVPNILSAFKANNPQFSVRTFNLTFNHSISLYEPGNDTVVNSVSFLNQAAFKNTVYSDLATKQAITEKFFFDHPVFIRDTLRKIKWRLTNETRTIANYLCRRANAVIMDSVYVVAYYTDQIITKSGPESFNGLPGMILGVAIPDEHITWFATKVITESTPPIKNIEPNVKDKTMSQTIYKNNTIKFLDEHNANTNWFLNFLCY